MHFATALEQLANYRSRSTRNSADVVEKGEFALKNNGLRKMGDDAWSFLEQLALAAMDTARYDLADDCINRLDEKFPESPRVDCLRGIRIESTGRLKEALDYYEEALEVDEGNAAFWKRKIAVYRQMGEVDKCIEELGKYLDTFYTDAGAWLELADLYASLNSYTHSLQSLSHAMVVAPQNPFYVLQAAETAYTASDVPLATRYYLRAIEMADDGGVARRAWFGVKLCARRLLSEPSSHQSLSETAVPTPKHLQALDLLATEKISGAYAAQEASKAVVTQWLSGK